MGEVLDIGGGDDEIRKIYFILNPTKDVGGSSKIELLSEKGELLLFNPFELFFSDPIKSKGRYNAIFEEIAKLLGIDDDIQN